MGALLASRTPWIFEFPLVSVHSIVLRSKTPFYPTCASPSSKPCALRRSCVMRRTPQSARPHSCPPHRSDDRIVSHSLAIVLSATSSRDLAVQHSRHFPLKLGKVVLFCPDSAWIGSLGALVRINHWIQGKAGCIFHSSGISSL